MIFHPLKEFVVEFAEEFGAVLARRLHETLVKVLLDLMLVAE